MRPLIAPLLLTAVAAWGFSGPGRGTDPDRGTSHPGRILAALDPALVRSLSSTQRQLLHRHVARLSAAQPRVGRCWAPGTDPTLVAAFLAAEDAARAIDPMRRDGGPQEARQLDERWSATATDGVNQGTQGLPVTLTWSIVPDGTPIPGDAVIGDSSDPSNLRAFLAGIYGGSASGPPAQQPWFTHFQSVFDNIAAKTGLTYVYQPDDDGITMNFTNAGVPGVRGDIRIGGHDFNEASSGDGTLAYNYFPNQGDMVIDTSDDWFVNHKDSPNHLGNLLEHEHGHGLGLNHVCPDNGTKLMEPFITTGFDGIQFDDIYSLQRHYGDFYEKHSIYRDNDTAASATPLAVVPDTPFATGWASIDDDTDTDFYRFSAPAGAIITVRVAPSTEAYPEGPQNASCSATTTFDSSAIHNLGLFLIAPDQATVLASSTSRPAGQGEEIPALTTSSSGFHYIKVSGDTANAAQLYRLEVSVEVPAIDLAIRSAPIVLESFAGHNGAADPGETVRVAITLANQGAIDAANVQSELAGPAGFTGFTTTRSFGNLPSGAEGTQEFVFALDGTCADILHLNLTVTADGGYLVKLPLPVPLGTLSEVLDEPFDAPTLPDGWTSTASGAGAGWAPSAAETASPPHAAFSANAGAVGESILTSPATTLGTGTSTLTFSHFYNTEAGSTKAYDGGVLEISIDSGPWTDILAAGGTFVTGGYNRTLNENFSNPLGGRAAWSGDSGGFLTTSVALPAAAAALPVRLRWRFGYDESQPDVGWFIDDIVLQTHTCDPPVPTLAITLNDSTASEFAPRDTASLTITTPLPPLRPIPITPANAGTADLSLDVTGLEALELAAGQTSLPVTIQAINDTLAEGDETLVLTFPGAIGTTTITITDTPYGQWAAARIGLGPHNGPLDDFDLDAATNLAEYAHQTDPASPAAQPDLHPRPDGAYFRIDAPLHTLPPDLHISAESSENLQIWSPAGIQTLPDGFRILAPPSPLFLRLTYDLLPTAP